jgi:hypothetical protein
MGSYIENLARELREVSNDLEQGQFQLEKLTILSAKNDLTRDKTGKSGQKREARTTQLIDEWFERMEKRLKVSPDMLDQAKVLRETADSLESNQVDFDEVSSVIAALNYAYGFDYGYRRFPKDRKELLPERSRASE